MFQHLFQLQQNMSTMLNQVSQSVVAVVNRTGTVFSHATNLPSVSSLPPITPVCEPDLRPSENFDGNREQCGSFLLQCNLAFAWSPTLFPNNAAKITYIVKLL